MDKREYQKQYRLAHKDAINANKRNWRARNPDYHKTYYKKHLDKWKVEQKRFCELCTERFTQKYPDDVLCENCYLNY